MASTLQYVIRKAREELLEIENAVFDEKTTVPEIILSGQVPNCLIFTEELEKKFPLTFFYSKIGKTLQMVEEDIEYDNKYIFM